MTGSIALVVFTWIGARPSRRRERRTLSGQSCAPEKHLCLMRVVRAAPELQVLDARSAAGGERHHVMEFQNPVSGHRPSLPTNEQRPSSRAQTVRFTAAGT